MKRTCNIAGLWAAIASLGCACWSTAAEEPESLDTVIVRGERIQDLRKAVRKAQDRLVREYNDANDDRRQALSCKDDAPTGTRLAKRSCSTFAQDQAHQEEAAAATESLSLNMALQDAELSNRLAALGADGPPISGLPLAVLVLDGEPVTSHPELDESTLPGVPVTGAGKASKLVVARDEFEANFARLLRENPKLRQRYDEYWEARRRYEEATRR